MTSQPQPSVSLPDPAPAPQPAPRRRKSTVIVSVILSFLFASIAIYQGCRLLIRSGHSASTDQSPKRLDDHKEQAGEAVAASPPIEVIPGEPPTLAHELALPERTFEIEDIAKSAKWDERFSKWMQTNNARPIGVYAVHFTVKALKSETTIKDFRLKDRSCPNEVAVTIDNIKRNMHGTLIYPPTAGNPGAADPKREVLGFNVSQYDESTARLMAGGYPRLGNVKAGTQGFGVVA